MSIKLNAFNQKQIKALPTIRPGATVTVFQRVKEGNKERIQPFKGIVIAKKHGKGINATITVRKISGGIGVERIFPIHSPKIEKIEITGQTKVRRAKLYYLRERTGKKARLKRVEIEKDVNIEKQPQSEGKETETASVDSQEKSETEKIEEPEDKTEKQAK